jgi:hypothetical protein
MLLKPQKPEIMPDKFVPLDFVATSNSPLVVLHNLYLSEFFRGFHGHRSFAAG